MNAALEHIERDLAGELRADVERLAHAVEHFDRLVGDRDFGEPEVFTARANVVLRARELVRRYRAGEGAA